jgi:hypothetical protein
MFKNYKHVLETFNIEYDEMGCHKIDEKHNLVIKSINKEPYILVRIQSNNKYLHCFNQYNYVVIEYPEQLYHILKSILEKLKRN